MLTPKVTVCTIAMLCLLAGSIIETEASSVGEVSFEGMGVDINLKFPEEAKPAESVSFNLTITATLSLKMNNFTLLIQALTSTGWVDVYREQMFPGSTLTPTTPYVRHIQFTIPQNSHGPLYCTMYALTDKVPSYPETNIFNATYIRETSYDEQLAEYSSLLTDYGKLLDSYDALSVQYGLLNTTHGSLQYSFQSLNSSYFAQKSSYDSLKAGYDSLETEFKTLNQTYLLLKAKDESLGNRDSELAITRVVMYALFAAAVTLVALVVYVKKMKSEPYIVVQKK